MEHNLGKVKKLMEENSTKAYGELCLMEKELQNLKPVLHDELVFEIRSISRIHAYEEGFKDAINLVLGVQK